MARGKSDSGGGFAAVFLVVLAIGFIVKFIWWIVGAPDLTIGPNFTAKTLELCAQGDAICDGTPGVQPASCTSPTGSTG